MIFVIFNMAADAILDFQKVEILMAMEYVHTVDDSTLMSIFDQFRFSFVFLGLPKIGHNHYT